jgi:glycosyltransferase involved in cell wall biosynthesis
MSQTAPDIAIRFEPEGYDIGRPQLVGRQVATLGFLRAAVAARGGRPVTGYGPAPFAEPFAKLIGELDPAAEAPWVPHDQLERLAKVGVCYRPDPQLGPEARLRLRVGAGAYALTGVLHTSATILDQLASLVSEPLTPWDALICPSKAVAESVQGVHAAEAEYLRWRFGGQVNPPTVQTPVIPLGVHCDDFVFDAGERAGARQALGLEADEVVALYVGRLSLMTKAHPFAMYAGLQAAAERTGRRLALVQCGWTERPALAKALEDGAAAFCPSVRSLIVDGREAQALRRCWAAADLFISASDNVQETFGLTPVEAMAAGLPAVVSDWNGYRETVRDGIDGFRIPTWAPQGGAGDHFARAREAGSLPLDLACWAAAASTSVDIAALSERLTSLVDSQDLRRQMGEAGRARAREVFDWRVVYTQYQALWTELDTRRRAVTPLELAWLRAAPAASAAGADFFAAFAHYPSATIGAATVLAIAPGATLARYRAVAGHPLFPMDPAPERLVAPIWSALEAGARTVAAVAQATDLPLRNVVLAAGALAKMGMLDLRTD